MMVGRCSASSLWLLEKEDEDEEDEKEEETDEEENVDDVDDEWFAEKSVNPSFPLASSLRADILSSPNSLENAVKKSSDEKSPSCVCRLVKKVVKCTAPISDAIDREMRSMRAPILLLSVC